MKSFVLLGIRVLLVLARFNLAEACTGRVARLSSLGGHFGVGEGSGDSRNVCNGRPIYTGRIGAYIGPS